jgi:hypothetical protein
MSTLEEWTLSGIGEWKLGDKGQSCNSVCNDQCVTLNERQQPLAAIQALPAHLGILNAIWLAGPTYAPLCEGPICFYNREIGSVLHCGVNAESFQKRICPCLSSTTPTYQGAVTCTNCAAGTYLVTKGDDTVTDCVPCVNGKFSAAKGATASDTCSDCVAGKFSLAGASICINCQASGPGSG